MTFQVPIEVGEEFTIEIIRSDGTSFREMAPVIRVAGVVVMRGAWTVCAHDVETGPSQDALVKLFAERLTKLLNWNSLDLAMLPE